VAPSARSALIVLAMASSTMAAGFAMSGCDTTQAKAARGKIRSERTLAAREPVKIGDRAKDVEADATLIASDDGTAVVVDLRNTGAESLSDLPIAVGARAEDGDEQELNGAKNLPYYQTHAPVLAAGETTTWVYVGKDKAPAGASAFAEVGAPPSPPLQTVGSLPTIDIGDPEPATGNPAKVAVSVTNKDGFTQYDLSVFAWATKGDRYVAAGFADAGDLEQGETEDVTLNLIGDPKGAELHVSAPPTIYQ
jgi:hypothetical protein